LEGRSESPFYESFAGSLAIAVGVGGFLYAVVFLWIVADSPGWVASFWYWLLVGGAILSVPALIGVYGRLRQADPGLALTGLLLGLGGALGGAVHGAYLLHLQLNPVRGLPRGPTPGDPAGIFRYGLAGLSLLVFGWLILRSGRFPRGLAYVGFVGGGLLVLIYLGRLYLFITPTVKVSLIPPVLYGLVVFPAWWLGVGLSLRHGEGVRQPSG
jgi:hypothetical protein